MPTTTYKERKPKPIVNTITKDMKVSEIVKYKVLPPLDFSWREMKKMTGNTTCFYIYVYGDDYLSYYLIFSLVFSSLIVNSPPG